VADTQGNRISLRSGWSEFGDTLRRYAPEEFEPIGASREVRATTPSVRQTAQVRAAAPPLWVAGQADGGSLQLRAEDLLVRKQPRDLGAVELRKELVIEEQTVDIPVWHEELIVQHERIDPPRPTHEPIGERSLLRVVLQEEVPLVDKQPVVTEVIRAGRRTVQDTQQVEATARREVARVRQEREVELHQDQAQPETFTKKERER
jgi:uncharacterized protein (TIGR02271 family)